MCRCPPVRWFIIQIHQFCREQCVGGLSNEPCDSAQKAQKMCVLKRQEASRATCATAGPMTHSTPLSAPDPELSRSYAVTPATPQADRRAHPSQLKERLDRCRRPVLHLLGWRAARNFAFGPASSMPTVVHRQTATKKKQLRAPTTRPVHRAFKPANMLLSTLVRCGFEGQATGRSVEGQAKMAFPRVIAASRRVQVATRLSLGE